MNLVMLKSCNFITQYFDSGKIVAMVNLQGDTSNNKSLHSSVHVYSVTGSSYIYNMQVINSLPALKTSRTLSSLLILVLLLCT